METTKVQVLKFTKDYSEVEKELASPAKTEAERQSKLSPEDLAREILK